MVTTPEDDSAAPRAGAEQESKDEALPASGDEAAGPASEVREDGAEAEDQAAASDENEQEESSSVEATGPSAEEQIADLKDRLLRAMAETENIRKRAAREREDTGKYAIAGMARDILGVADNLRRAIDSAPDGERTENEALANLLTGVEMTERELTATLERRGIRPIDPAGEKFDANRHQAMYEVPGTDAAPGTVVEVVQIGYTIADRLLRPAAVGVAAAQTATEQKPHAESSEGEADSGPGDDRPAGIDTRV